MRIPFKNLEHFHTSEIWVQILENFPSKYQYLWIRHKIEAMSAGYDDAPRSVERVTYGYNTDANGRWPTRNQAPTRSHTTGSFFEAKGKEAELLDVMDKLKELSTRHKYPLPGLPQIIVCGSQTAGKSSVLEAIAEIPFPRSTGVCTKYVTKVTLERKEDDRIRMHIIPDPGRPKAEREDLAQFRMEIPVAQWRNDAVRLMEEAVSEVNDRIFSGSRKDKRWTKDTLSITISATDKRPLQVLDLPGLIGHDKKKEGNIELVEEIVAEEMAKSHCLILAVVEGQDDLDKHIILERCDHHDPHGQRTIVVVTKLDSSLAKSTAPTYINAIQGRDKTYSHRWHVLRNRTQEEIEEQTTTFARDRTEQEFFDEPPWDQVDPQFKGIEALRGHLRDKLFKMAREVLPKLSSSMKIRLENLNEQLEHLGGENSNPDDLRKIFQKAILRLQNRARDHARGIYEYDITHFEAQGTVNLRARVVRQNWLFHDRILKDGQEWERTGNRVVDPDADLKSILDAPGSANDGSIIRSGRTNDADRVLSEEREHRKAIELLILKAGRELPGMVNSERINDLFWLLSKNWQPMTKEHIEDVYCHCRNYFKTITPLAFARTQTSEKEADGFYNPEAVAARFVEHHVMPGLEQRKKRAMEELNKLEADRRESVQNYNKRYMAEYRQQRNARNFSLAMQAQNKSQNGLGKTGEMTADVYAGYECRHSQEGRIEETSKDFLNATWIHYLVSVSSVGVAALLITCRSFGRTSLPTLRCK